jgi:pyruvate dehydrogenase E2 component (dihydrolipoamide acetyltransferase)
MIDFTMPRYGFMQRGTVVRWYKKEGEEIQAGEVIAQVESEKVMNDVESPQHGYLKEIVVQEGQEQEVFKTIAWIAESEAELAQQPLPNDTRERAPSSGAVPATIEVRPDPRGGGESERVKASPAARKLADQLNVELTGIEGTGPGGRVTEADVSRYVARQAGPPGADYTEEALSPTRKSIAAHLLQGCRSSATVTQAVRATCDALVQIKGRARVSVSALLATILGSVLLDLPEFNSHLVDGKVRRFAAVDLGVAVHTDYGLVVPVIRGVDRKTLEDVHEELRELAERARRREISRNDLEGSTFTLSNLGMTSTDFFTPILNFPEVAILGVGRIGREIGVGEGDRTSIVNKAWLCLSYEHQVIDGAQAGGFLQRLERLLDDEEDLLRVIRQKGSVGWT